MTGHLRTPFRPISRTGAAAVAGAVLLFAGALPPAVPAAAHADEVTEQIQQALKAYERKDFPTAAVALDTAASLIRQKKAESWKTVLPEPLPGWTGEEPDVTTYGAVLLGGGTSVSRVYRRGIDRITVTLIGDSPVLQGLGSFLASGLVANSDMKVSVIDGRRVMFTRSDNSYQTMVANKVLVKVEGDRSVDDATLRSYLRAVKFGEVERLAAR
jgi:hypothetical protein